MGGLLRTMGSDIPGENCKHHWK